MPKDLMQMLAPLFDQATKMNDIEGSQNLLFPKGFVKKHPRISSMVEGAVLGAALTKPSSTPGEGISNVAQAILGIPEFKKNKQMQKILAPLGMMQQGLEMQKLQADTGLAQARATKLGLPEAPDTEQKAGVKVDAMGRPIGFSYDPNEGKFTSQQIDVPEGTTFDPPGTTAGTDIERFVEKRNAERAAEGTGPMNTTEEASFRNKLYSQRIYGGAFAGGLGREAAGGLTGQRSEFLRTNKKLAQDEVALYDVDIGGAIDLVVTKRAKNIKDVARLRALAEKLRDDYLNHLNMGGTLTFQQFKDQQQPSSSQNPFDPGATARPNPYRSQ